MSSHDLGRMLKIVVSTESEYDYLQAIQDLGHTVLGRYSDTAELLQAAATLQSTPDTLITSATKQSEISSIRIFFPHTPLIIISRHLAELKACEELKYVFGVSAEPHDHTSLRAVLLLAIVRFSLEEKWKFEVDKTKQELEHTKLVHRACSLLVDYGHAPTLTGAYRDLQRVATSYSRTLHDQAQRIINAADRLNQEVSPKESTRKKRKP